MVRINFRRYFEIVICTIFLISSLSTLAQNDTRTQEFEEVNKAARKMFVDMNNRDFDAILDMTYPKVFDFATKDQMKSVIKATLEGNEELSMEIPKMMPEYKLSKIFKVQKDSLEYAFVSYDMRMKMTFHKQEFDNDGKKMMIGLMKAKGMDVKFVSNNTLDILMKDRITILIKDSLTNNKWAMVNYDPDSPMFYQMVPSSLLESAKTYKQNLMLESKKKSDKSNSTTKN